MSRASTLFSALSVAILALSAAAQVVGPPIVADVTPEIVPTGQDPADS